MDLFPLPLNNDALVLDGLLAELRERFQDGLAIFNLPLPPDEQPLPLQQDQDLPPDEIPRLFLPEGLDIRYVDPKTQFRFTIEEIGRIAIALDLDEWIVTDSRLKIGRIEGLCLVLHRLSYPRRYADASIIFRRSLGALSQLFHKVIKTIYQDWKHLLLFDHVRLTPQILRTLANAVAAKDAPLPNCFGFIDGTSVHICRPTRNQEVFYSGYKRYHAIKYQGVVTPDGIIVHLSGPYRGRQHDSSILTDSYLRQYLAEHGIGPEGEQMVLYGDEGYPRLGQIQSPFRGRVLPQDQYDFNTRMRRPRLCIEWAFGHIVNNWGFTNYSHNLRCLMSPVGQYYPLAALFSNIQVCLGRNTPSLSYYEMAPPELEEYLTPRNQWDATREVMVAPVAFNEPWNNFQEEDNEVPDI
jgi:hypothetical protein